MYNIIWYFQIICIIVTLGCVYLASQNSTLKIMPGRDTWMLTMLGLFVAECGYGLFFQAVTLEGLQIARKVYLVAGVATLASWIVTVVSEKKHAKFLAAMGALVASSFAASDSLERYLFRDAQMMQNQYFYYIEESKQGLYYAGKLLVAVLLAVTVVVLLLKKSEEGIFAGKKRVWFAVATLLPCIALVMGDLAMLRYYPLMSPVLMLSDVCLVMGLYKNDSIK